MFDQNENQEPISPMKKLKILSEKQVNVIRPLNNFESIKKEKPQINQKETINEQIINEETVETNNETIEPLLVETPGQYVIFPINHEDMWSMYKDLVNNFWSFSETIQELEKLTLNYNEKMFMKHYSSIFASSASRGLVNENFAEDFCKLIQVTEAKFFYGHQLFVQNIHYEMYNKLLDYFVPENIEKDKLFKIVENYDSVTKKRNWIAKWKNSSFGDQIMASACLHGLLFISLDLVCNWLKNRNRNQLFHEITDILERMIIDQNLQRDFSCLMIGHLKNKPSIDNILETINEAAKVEFDFILNGLNVDLINIDSDEVIQLIDRKTTELKTKIFQFYKEGKKQIQQENDKNKNEFNNLKEDNNENTNQSKENYQKLTFDEDF